MPRKTTADAVARPIDQRARRELEEQILECGPTVTSLHDIGAGLICQYAKGTEKYHLYARFIANGKRVYAAIGDYPTLTCDEILEARNALYWNAMGKKPPKAKETKEEKMEAKKDVEPKVAGNHQEPATPQAAAGAEEVAEKDTAFADKISDLLFGIRSFSKQAQAAILTAAIDAEVKTWQN